MAAEENNLVVSQCCLKFSPETADSLQPSAPIHVTKRYCIYHPVSRDTTGQVLCEVGWLVNHHRRHEPLAICLWKYEKCALEGYAHPILGTPDLWDIAPDIGANNAFPLPIGIKANLVAIPNLRWLESWRLEGTFIRLASVDWMVGASWGRVKVSFLVLLTFSRLLMLQNIR